MTRPRLKVLIIAMLIGAMTLTACGDDDNSPGTKLTALGEKLPNSIKQSGVIRVGSDIEYPPIEFFKEGTKEVQGVDWDLAQAMGKELGVTFKFTNDTDFAGIIGAMNSGRFDIIMSAMNDTAERRGQGVDFIDYFLAGTSMIVKKGNPSKIETVDDLCGETVSVQKGTFQETDILTPQVAKCQTAGKPLNLLSFEKDADALQQVKTGRSVANLEDFPVAAYNALISGGGNDFEVVGDQLEVGRYGIAVPASNTALREALRAALRAIIKSGEYDHIMEKWNVAKGALKTAELNGGS
ncbi:MAG: polar amino acid transport system substrate-binding protein [Actinomycetota bacterium]|jgi:polar amino acid transport system substrate-binding protein